MIHKAFSLKVTRQTLLDDAPCVTRSQIDDDPLPAVFHPRRFSDPISDLNAMVYDKARLLASAVEMVDRMGLQIISVEAINTRNSRILVIPSRACAALGGVEVARTAEYSHWCATRNGVEIRWCVEKEGALVPSPEGCRV